MLDSQILSAGELAYYVEERYSGIWAVDTWGEKSFFYNPDNLYPKGVYFCTIKEKDGQNDRASSLNREGVYRFNFGISKSSFVDLFFDIPSRPAKGGVIDGIYNFTTANNLSPHPIYGWMCWVSILNPSLSKIEPLLDESYSLAIEKYKKKRSL